MLLKESVRLGAELFYKHHEEVNDPGESESLGLEVMTDPSAAEGLYICH